LVEYYRRRGKLFRIDGTRPVDRVFTEVDRILQKADTGN